MYLQVFVCFFGGGAAAGLGVNELLYFRVISPEEIGYIFSAAPAKDFGGDFVSAPSSFVFHSSTLKTSCPTHVCIYIWLQYSASCLSITLYFKYVYCQYLP